MKLLNKLCEIHAPSGNESEMKRFILDYVNKCQKRWTKQPVILHGDEFQDCVMLIFGKPRAVVFAHMDSVGFTVRYHDQLLPIGSPEVESGYRLKGQDSLGPILCQLEVLEEYQVKYKFPRAIQRGTDLTFDCNFRETENFVQSCYLDNRLGVYNALKLAEKLEDGIIAFSCWEEHGGGSVPVLAKYVYEKYQVKQALISDITWITEGIEHGKGVVVSMRDKNIPRKSFIDKIIDIADRSGIDYQLEVEGHGSSDARELQISPYPFDWCFIGAPEDNVHSPDEIVHKHDIDCMLNLYQILMKEL